MFAQVIVDIVHENVAHTFTYTVPEGMGVQPGHRVRVPFGYRTLEGIVLEVTESYGGELAPEKLKPLMGLLEPEPAVLPPLMTLARRMAEEAHCPLAQTLRLMLPAEMRGGRVKVKTQQTARLAFPKEQLEEKLGALSRSPRQRMLLTLLGDGEDHGLDEMKELVSDPLSGLKRLAEMGLVTMDRRELLRSPGGHAEAAFDPPLTPSQKEVLGEMLPRMERGEGRFLLHGVTGSGKTEVFIRMVRRCMELGKGAIILVPEIALTPQMVSWFRSRFGEGAAVIHSRLSAGERYDEWRRIRRGDARVVIGARSAVFAPVERLGLIVVDEEHESTYLSDHHPRYDARDVAAIRCGQEGAALLLSSATPSILSFARARRGDYTLLEMPTRVLNRPMPEVEIADMRKELENGNRSIFSALLQTRLRQCLEKGEQAMLLMNHRGYSSFVSCRSCGKVIKCPNCDVALTYHLTGGDGMLHCHYCGHAQAQPTECPECRSKYIRYFGAGTQKVEQELNRLYPGVRVVRMDMDTTSGKDGHARLLEEFRSGKARILVGTQMIAKGLDFPRVTLVGAVAADLTLNLPDYRSRERTFQLLTQMAGRAGRGEEPGRVVIQTYKPEDVTILQAADQDYRAFFEAEFLRRRMGLYPPFTIMARLLVEAPDGETARSVAVSLKTRVDELLAAHPVWRKRTLMCLLDQPPLSVLRGKTRYHVLLKLLVHPDTEAWVASLTQMARQEYPGAQVFFEYNPTSMI